MVYVGYSVLASAVHHTPTCAVGVLLCDMRRFVVEEWSKCVECSILTYCIHHLYSVSREGQYVHSHIACVIPERPLPPPSPPLLSTI